MIQSAIAKNTNPKTEIRDMTKHQKEAAFLIKRHDLKAYKALAAFNATSPKHVGLNDRGFFHYFSEILCLGFSV